MIGCDTCEEWFHAACFNIKLSEIEDIQNFPFVCPKCQEKVKKLAPTSSMTENSKQKLGTESQKDKKRNLKEKSKLEIVSQRSTTGKV